MRYPIFTLFMLFIAWYTIKRVNAEKKEKDVEKKFWSKESAANSTRRKDISDLPFLEILLEQLPFDMAPTDDTVTSCEAQIRDLSNEKILNLTGITNTELKLTYGAPNLTELTQYDHNFTLLVRALDKWASRLYELSFEKEAVNILSFAVLGGSDIKSSYTLLAKAYQNTGQLEKIEALKDSAKLLNSLRKESILRELDSY